MAFFKHHPKVDQLEQGVSEALKEELARDEWFVRAPFDEEELERTGSAGYSYWRSTLRAFRRNKVAMVLLVLLLLVVSFTFVQPYLPNQIDPNVSSIKLKNGRPSANSDALPGSAGLINELNEIGQIKRDESGKTIRHEVVHILGTDSNGYDMWALLWAGTRNSLFIGICVALIEAAVGIFIGVLWGYVRSLDFLFTEIYNVLDNIPTTIVLILVSFILRPSMGTLIFAMSITGWIGMARFIRNQVLIIRDRDYNVASRCLGTSTWRIIMKNLLPYLISVIMLRMALSIPGAIGSEVFITYIGLGLPADIPSLGKLITEGRKLLASPSKSYQLIYPTIVLSFVTVSFYMIGNAFSDAADPRTHL